MVVFRSQNPPASILDILEQRCEEHPDRLLYTFLPDDEGTEPVSRTYGEVRDGACAVAEELWSRGVGNGPALLLFPPGPEFVEAFLGCLYAGVIAVPAYPPTIGGTARPLIALDAIARDARPRAVMTTRALADACRSMPGASSWASSWVVSGDVVATDDGSEPSSPERSSPECSPPRLPAPDGVAFLQYTSGATGSPRGVVVRHSNLIVNEERIRLAFGMTENDRVVGWLPPYHDMGLIGLVLQPLYVGASCTLLSPFSFLKRPSRWLREITKRRATACGGPNFGYEMCTVKITDEEFEDLDLSSLSLAFSGAEPVRLDTLRGFAKRFSGCGFDPRAFLPCYGLAESTLLAAAGGRSRGYHVFEGDRAALEAGTAVPASGGPVTRLVGCGTALPGHEIRIVDPRTGTLLREHEVGEICLAGPSVTDGYWGGTLPPGGAKDPGPGQVRTGDLGFLHEEELYVTGRLKEIVIVREGTCTSRTSRTPSRVSTP